VARRKGEKERERETRTDRRCLYTTLSAAAICTQAYFWMLTLPLRSPAVLLL